MLRNACDLFIISLFGFFKVTLFLIIFCISLLFFTQSNDLALDESNAFAGFLVNPGSVYLKPASLADSELTRFTAVPRLEEMTPEEAEIYFLILRLSESINQPNARRLAKLIVKECSNYDKLDPYLILAVIQVESEFSPKAISKKGAIGLMQVMPGTAQYIAKEMGLDYDGTKSLYDPFINVELGIHYLSLLTDKYDSMENALEAYNYGPSNFDKAQASDSDKKQSMYVKKVLDFKNYLQEESLILAKNS